MTPRILVVDLDLDSVKSMYIGATLVEDSQF